MTLTFQTYFFCESELHVRQRTQIHLVWKNRFNVQLSFSTSSSERHRLDFNVEHWSRNYHKVDPRKFRKSPRRSHPKTPLSKTSNFLKSRSPKVPEPISGIEYTSEISFSFFFGHRFRFWCVSCVWSEQACGQLFFVNTWSGVCGLVWSLFIDHSP